ncbi:hypothetical protein BLA24_08160 [Streptomyces cinnamoneus]|uniref:Uncharacterized protein n=1 Tax=Streptomyces cinnamoneus TaxID=53446 RepID=A0A2G1XMK3_STRCJ|nr:DUF4188 domain-containing protein [Streptomyces cinnamoneus]PHQ51961.1 hypothetical protein BLA24_10635 [Streptomyces cinnamoneus]PHQ52401.1 hypothetical protein BLA24_08160 [Streptomyces cinnamoneus]PPT11602.1 DUF4188 domain-containing protein [Streptomyces cinnamoneus]
MGMAPISERRVTAAAEGEVVVFLIGMRINRWRAVRHWLPVLTAMPRMLKELSREGSGLLGLRGLRGGPRVYGAVQYWESREKLLAYASDQGGEHRPAWAAFNRRVRDSKGGVGIWHETYVVPAGSYESVYVDMPPAGLGAAWGVEPVGRRGERAAQRMASGAV